MLDLIEELAARAAANLMEHYGEVAREDVELKGPRDLVSYVDTSTEALLVDAITERFPDDGILGEEGASREGTSGARWILDPLDGTTNYLHRIPYFAVSIGYERDGVMEAGVVAAPALDAVYAAARGQGARKNGEPIRVSGCAAIGEALLGTGFADNRQTEPYRTTRFERVLNLGGGVRRVGAAAMDLCMVAEGVLDGFWEWNLSPWDVAAGALIVREAGGTVTDGSGGDAWLTGRTILATNGRIHDALLSFIHEELEDPRLSALQVRMREFVAARRWEGWHTPKNLALSVGIEAGELQEVFQWLSEAEAAPGALPEAARREAADEMADVLAYLLSLANTLGVDLASAFQDKMARNAARYPPGGEAPRAWGRGEGGGA